MLDALDLDRINVSDEVKATVIRRYREGATLREIGRETAVCRQTAAKIVRAAKLDVVTREDRARQRALDLPIDVIAREYLAGVSAKSLARRYGTEPGAIHRRLEAAGVELRGQSEALRQRMQRLTPEQRRIHMRPAQAAIRGHQRPTEELVRRASTREGRGDLASVGEHRLREMLLARGVETIPQQAIGPYNCDLGAFPVAVEVYGGYWHWTGRHLAR